ncbi:MAG: hypothetical protein IPI20_18425 [Rhodoferax sp.]|nr:hypothetical protein [Rhodoferax sp.]
MDSILYWNGVALEANRRDFSNVPGTEKPAPEQGGPTLSSRALAIVHLAMYDAHAGVVNIAALPRYLATPPNPAAGASAAAAVAAAAHDCLSALFPRQQSHFDVALQAAGLTGAGVTEGFKFGQLIAKAMLNDRNSDAPAHANGYFASNAPMHHRPDPANAAQGFHAPFYGAGSKCFGVTARHALDVPPALGSAEYDKALKQVRGKGIAPQLMGTLPTTYTKRTVDETLVGVYWAYDGPRELGTPPRMYNQIVREIAMKKGNSVDDNARLFALVNTAMGDAGILAWDQKYIHDVWRPVLGVREHDGSMGLTAPTPPTISTTTAIPPGCPWVRPPATVRIPISHHHFPPTRRAMPPLARRPFTPCACFTAWQRATGRQTRCSPGHSCLTNTTALPVTTRA